MNETPPRKRLKNITPYVAKLAFRAFLPMFAAWWAEARDSAPQESLNAAVWPDYLRLLRACQDVLDHAPMHPNEAKQINVHRRYDRSVERLATMLASLFPNGFLELESYVLTEQVSEWRRARGLARYYRVKRRRYRKGRGRR